MTTSGPPERGRQDPEDVDRLFREIIAGYDQESPPDPAPDRPDSGAGHDDDLDPHLDLDPDHDHDASPADDADRSPAAGRLPRPVSHLGPGTPAGMATDHRSYEPPEDPDDDHFVPPPTPPLPAGDLHFWGIVVGLVGGPLLLFVSAVIPILGTPWATLGALLLIGGFVLLVLRLPRHHGGDDSGAQV